MNPFNLESVVKYLNHCKLNYNPVEKADLCLSVALTEILERLNKLEQKTTKTEQNLTDNNESQPQTRAKKKVDK